MEEYDVSISGWLLKELREVMHVGFGPTIADILPVTR
jgi:hypothetical protein